MANVPRIPIVGRVGVLVQVTGHVISAHAPRPGAGAGVTKFITKAGDYSHETLVSLGGDPGNSFG